MRIISKARLKQFWAMPEPREDRPTKDGKNHENKNSAFQKNIRFLFQTGHGFPSGFDQVRKTISSRSEDDRSAFGQRKAKFRRRNLSGSLERSFGCLRRCALSYCARKRC